MELFLRNESLLKSACRRGETNPVLGARMTRGANRMDLALHP
jgi:hypothetical protein